MFDWVDRQRFKRKSREFCCWIRQNRLWNPFAQEVVMTSLWNMMSKNLELTRKNFVFLFFFFREKKKKTHGMQFSSFAFMNRRVLIICSAWYALRCTMTVMGSVNTCHSSSSSWLPIHSQSGRRWAPIACFGIPKPVYPPTITYMRNWFPFPYFLFCRSALLKYVLVRAIVSFISTSLLMLKNPAFLMFNILIECIEMYFRRVFNMY